MRDRVQSKEVHAPIYKRQLISVHQDACLWEMRQVLSKEDNGHGSGLDMLYIQYARQSGLRFETGPGSGA